MQEVTIERLGRQGDGLAGPLRAPFTLPSERVRGVVDNDRMNAAEILQPSPDRIAPVCPHFGTCGGCALQHASDEFLAAWKTDIIARALAAQGLSAPIRPIAVSPPLSRRRATFAGRRTRKTVSVGFHARRSDEIVAVATCDLLRPEITACLAALHDLTGLGASRAHAIRLAVTHGPAGLDIDATGAKLLDAPLRARLAALAEDHELARLTWDGDTVALRHSPAQTIGAAYVTPPPGAFLQATSQGEAALVAAVREAVGDARHVADLFAGCGTFSLPLAETTSVHAVEGAGEMLAALDAGWRAAHGLKRVTTERRDLFRRPMLPGELKDCDAVVIDPPRAGAEAQTRELAASGMGRIALVSCDPATFARDAAILVNAGFTLDWIQPIDQFRWSGHVELAAQFTRS